MVKGIVHISGSVCSMCTVSGLSNHGLNITSHILVVGHNLNTCTLRLNLLVGDYCLHSVVEKVHDDAMVVLR